MAKLLIRNRNKDKYYKDGKAKPPNWEYRFETAPIDGKRTHCSEAGFRTKSEAEEAGTKAKALYESAGQTFKPSETSVSDYLDYWIDTYCKTNLKVTTIEGYKKKMRLYIKPVIGHYRLKSLQPSQLQELINDMFNKGFSWNTLSSVKGILTLSLDYAVEPCKFLAINPAVHVKLPIKRAKPEVPTRKKERRPVTLDEWNQIMERFPEGEPSHIPLVLAYRCGMRLGEVFGIMWEDIDFDAATLRIDRQVQMNEQVKLWEFQPPKYDSYRTIHLDTATLELLKREYDKQQRAKVYYDKHYKQLHVDKTTHSEHFFDSGLLSTNVSTQPVHMVMSRESGEFIQPRILQHVGRIIHGKYKEGYPVISADWDYHSLRHTHATMLYESGLPMSLIQERLGHAKIETTNVYTHNTPKMQEQLNNKLEELFK